ncbi:radical SAM/SPASM domain-containing protein [Abyssisolibacter fermentans]|uniref:radical SAM/SPASM domain-containing protein n=1 Tax=Abyssisolibacter fermentans TaxID=1766203 RepID=UPI00082A221E|nr:radical SAM protein [Abyssisolibacter fermentans]
MNFGVSVFENSILHVHEINQDDFLHNYIYSYIPVLLPSSYYAIKDNYVDDKGKIGKFFINRFPIDKKVIMRDNDYRLLFYRINGEQQEFIEFLESDRFDIEDLHYNNNIINLLFVLTKQKTVYWVKKENYSKDLIVAYNEYLKSSYLSTNQAVEIMARFNTYKYGISNLYTPGQVSILTTNRCNAACIHCYRRNSIHKEELLDTKTILKFIDDLASLSVTSINLLGGEPTLREDLKDIIKKCVDKNILLKITTNGVKLADENFVENLIDVWDSSLVYFQISVDGIEEIQNKLRPGASWETLIRAFENLNKYNMRWNTNSVVTKLLYQNLENFIKVLNQYDVPQIRFTMLKRCGDGNEYENMVLTDYEINEAKNLIDQLSIKYNQNVINGLRNPIFINQNIPSKHLDSAYHSCNAMNYQFTLSYNLQYLPCEFYEPFPEAWGESYEDMSIFDFWHKSVLAKQYRKIELVGKCNDCQYNLYCTKGCPAETLSITGDIRNSSPLCWYDPSKERNEQLELPR